MRAARIDLVLEQGATWDTPFTWETSPNVPKDLTGWTARMHIRTEVDTPTTLMELTTTAGTLVVDGPTGTTSLNVAPAVTAALTWTEGVYDLELVRGAELEVRRLVEGRVRLSPEVTR